MSKQRQIARTNTRFADGVRAIRFIKTKGVVRVSSTGLPRMTLRDMGDEVVVKAYHNGKQRTLHTGTADMQRAYKKAVTAFWPA